MSNNAPNKWIGLNINTFARQNAIHNLIQKRNFSSTSLLLTNKSNKNVIDVLNYGINYINNQKIDNDMKSNILQIYKEYCNLESTKFETTKQAKF